jgi:translation initiation factor 4E
MSSASSLINLLPSAPCNSLVSLNKDGDSMENLVDRIEEIKLNHAADVGLGEPEKYIKHPLQNAWTLWFFKNDKSRTWEENQRPIITVTTVEDFWSLYNHIEVASRLPPGADYSLFKEGIFPDWEDPRNQEGGRWIITLDKRQQEKHLDSYWLEIIFFLIGEHGDHDAFQVNGAVVNIRGRTDKLAVWLADATHNESVMRIGKMIKQRLGIDSNTTIGFNVHHEEKNKPTSANANKPKYFV